MNLFEENEEILKEWRILAEKYQHGDVSPDGVYYKGGIYLNSDANQMWRYIGNEDEQWLNAKRRILFVSKEPNEENNAYDMRGIDLTTNIDGSKSFGCRFNKNLLRITTGLSTLTKSGYDSWEKVNDIDYVSKIWQETAVARINLKKHSGASTTDMNKLFGHLELYKHLILSQLRLLSPNIIVCCGGSSRIMKFIIEEFLKENPSDLKSKTDNWIYYSPYKDIWVIDSYHMNPMSNSTDEDLYENVMKNLWQGLNRVESKI